MAAQKFISSQVIKRLPRYYRFLGALKEKNTERISSMELSKQMGLTASQIRQDLNCFGGFGQQGYGYNVATLHDAIGEILGVEKDKKTVILGAGNLGQAIARHMSFAEKGFKVIGIFDKNEKLSDSNVIGLPVRSIGELPGFCRQYQPVAAVLCIPNTPETEEVIDTLIENGVKAFWNFTHIDINAKYPEAKVENVHLSDSLLTLCYKVNSIK